MSRSTKEEYQYDVKEIGKTDDRGTIITFSPDKEIFTSHEYKYDTVAIEAEGIIIPKCWNKDILIDERDIDENGEFKKETFFSEGGLVEFR